MMSRKIQAAFAFSVVALSHSSLAVAEPAPAPAAAPTSEAAASEDKMICRKVDTIGSRLRSERVCMTSREWALKKQQDRQSLEQRQTQGNNRSF